MMDESFEEYPPLQVSMLGELMYCARLPYWRLIAMMRLPKSPLMAQGEQLHARARERLDVLQCAQRLGVEHVEELAWERPLQAPGWTGRADLVVSLGGQAVALVECKRTLRAHPQAAHIQLATYAWMLGLEGLEVRSAWAWSLVQDRWEQVELGEPLMATAAKLRELLERWRANPSFPDVSEQRAGLERRELCDLCPCDALCLDQLREVYDHDPMDRLVVSARRAKRQRSSADVIFF